MSQAPAPEGWSLEKRVNRAIVAVLAMVLLLVAVVVLALVSAKQKGDDALDRWDPALLARARSTNGMLSQETAVRGFASGKKVEFLEAYTAGVEPIATGFADLEEYVAGDAELTGLLDAYVAAYDTWRTTVAEPIIQRTRDGDPTAEEDAVSDASKAAFDDVRATVLALIDGLTTRADEAKAARERAFVYVWISVAVGVVLLLAAGVVLARGLRRSVLAPINGLVAQTRAVAGGALDQRIEQTGPLEIESLAADVDSMRASLNQQIVRIERARLRLQQRSAELARSNADLEQFAYVASHDLSEPLRKVTNFCQLLERQYADELDDKARQYIAFMVDGAKRMQILITDLLAFSRVGRTTEHFTEVSLDEALARALGNLESQLTAAGAHVTHASLPTVTGDPTLLAALLQNLVGNAVKYRSDDRAPRVEITAERISDRGVDSWLFTVSDNGIGIDAQYAERIFTIFQRLHLRDQYGGTGIGLALCRKIVDFHRGRIWLAESPEPGARFKFTLPLVQSPLETADDDEPSLHAHA